ncbi:hypothetical protein [Xylanimonas sp. McL0601]|uniref:hypothetical protein n=1 Tax=Xylanimonas sp. McL0601 TaxID=3414739 RepID=UPI003CFAAEE2
MGPSGQAHSAPVADEAAAVARPVGALALDHFPATILPNPLIQELSHLLATGSVATNGTVIEQAQILTTHNLAALVYVGVEPGRSWTELAVGRAWPPSTRQIRKRPHGRGSRDVSAFSLDSLRLS